MYSVIPWSHTVGCTSFKLLAYPGGESRYTVTANGIRSPLVTRTGTIKCPTPAFSYMSGRPLDVLEAALGDRVRVRLKSGEAYVGDLAGYDQHMNLVLEDVALSAATGSVSDDDTTASVEDTTIIRGDNVVSITP